MAEIHDIEDNWEINSSYTSTNEIIFRNKLLPSLYRRISIKDQKVSFSDTNRVTPDRIIDINKKLSLLEKGTIIPQIMAVINAIRPIEFPYTPEELTVYVEVDGRYLGILFYKVPPKAVIPIKKFFYRDPLSGWEEISYMQFRTEVGENVDQNTEQTENN